MIPGTNTALLALASPRCHRLGRSSPRESTALTYLYFREGSFRARMHSTERRTWRARARQPSGRAALVDHLRRGLHFTWISLKVLAHDANLLVLPFLALISMGFVWMLVVLSVWALGPPPQSPSSAFLYYEIFAAYLITWILSVYFMTAIVGATQARLRGEKPMAAEGIRIANACLLRLLPWALAAATVGVVLRLLSLRWEIAGRAVTRMFGYPWAIATVFVLPAMALEGAGPVRGVHRSRELLHEIWGSRQAGLMGTGIVFGILALLGLVPLLWGLLDPAAPHLLAVAVFYWLILAVLWSVVHGILVTALYHYATESEASFGFSWQALNHPWAR